MALIVQKFGGTSVGSIERIQNVARWVLDYAAQGHELVVVSSAMAGETNRLVGLATQIDPSPYSREYDMMIASGEQVAIGLLSLAINVEAKNRGLIKAEETKARPLLGFQMGILTDNIYSKARIREINTQRVRQELGRGIIPVVAGFQGVDSHNNITTLGRGGSDTSAVAIAAALKADECEIYTDVDGVYTTDPRLCSEAKKISKISYEEMMELASLGAKVLQIRSVELAAKYRIPLHVRSSFDPVEGTRVVSKEDLGPSMEDVVVAGVAAATEQVKITLKNVPNEIGIGAKIFTPLSDAAISVDVIVQDVSQTGTLSISFTIQNTDAHKAIRVLEGIQKQSLPEMKITQQGKLSKVSIVGVGMAHHPGVASRMFNILSEAGIGIELVTTSEIKVSCLIDEAKTSRAVEALHHGFGLSEID